MWEELQQWEKKHNAVVYCVLSTQCVREDLRYYRHFDPNEDDYKWDIDTVPEHIILDCMQDVNADATYGYGETIEDIHTLLVQKLTEQDNKGKGQFWNADTQSFETYEQFMGNDKGGA